MSMIKFVITSVLFLTLSLVGYLGLGHSVALNSKKTISTQLLNLPTNKYNLVHFLGGRCGCSKHIADKLLKRGPNNSKNESETIILIDDAFELKDRLLKAGFSVHSFDMKKNNLSLDGVPMFSIVNENKVVLYSGGYAETMIGPLTKIQDLEMLDKIKQHKPTKTNPIYGCAVSEEYKKLLDPFGLKYGEENESSNL